MFNIMARLAGAMGAATHPAAPAHDDTARAAHVQVTATNVAELQTTKSNRTNAGVKAPSPAESADSDDDVVFVGLKPASKIVKAARAHNKAAANHVACADKDDGSANAGPARANKNPWLSIKTTKRCKAAFSVTRKIIIERHHVPCTHCGDKRTCHAPLPGRQGHKCFHCSQKLRGECDWGEKWLNYLAVREWTRLYKIHADAAECDVRVFGSVSGLLGGPLDRQPREVYEPYFAALRQAIPLREHLEPIVDAFGTDNVHRVTDKIVSSLKCSLLFRSCAGSSISSYAMLLLSLHRRVVRRGGGKANMYIGSSWR